MPLSWMMLRKQGALINFETSWLRAWLLYYHLLFVMIKLSL